MKIQWEKVTVRNTQNAHIYLFCRGKKIHLAVTARPKVSHSLFIYSVLNTKGIIYHKQAALNLNLKTTVENLDTFSNTMANFLDEMHFLKLKWIFKNVRNTPKINTKKGNAKNMSLKKQTFA